MFKVEEQPHLDRIDSASSLWSWSTGCPTFMYRILKANKIRVYLDSTGLVQIESAFPAILLGKYNEHTEALMHRPQRVLEVSPHYTLQTRLANGVFQLVYRGTGRNRSFWSSIVFVLILNCSESNELLSNSQNSFACRHSASWKVSLKLPLC